MKIAMLGAGYVGLTTGACLADLGNDVSCVDIDKGKIDNLQKGILPIYEPGLKDVVDRNVEQNRISFSTDAVQAIRNAEVVFIAVGTPMSETGEADLKYVFQAAETIGKVITKHTVIVNKSTVPVGSAARVNKIIQREIEQRKKAGEQVTTVSFDVVCNPEFLREGEAIKDFMNPDRVIIGAESEKAKELMTRIYKGIERVGRPIVIMDIKSAELVKYAANAMLASRISFMNQLANFAEKVGADIKEVAKGIGLDSRIGPRFLQAGMGYGGSCFPKDVKALIHSLKNQQCNTELLEAIDRVNEHQKRSILTKVKALVGDLEQKKIAIWGIAFKPKTDDIREAPSLVIIEQLINEGASVVAFDPAAEENAKKQFGSKITYGKDPYATVEGCDCLVIVTEWDTFRYLDKQKIKELMKTPCIVDARNIYDPKEMRDAGFTYLSIGRK